MSITPRVVVVGTGWGGAKFTRYLDAKKFNITVISPRNHFIFTPLLPQTCTGSLEFRAVIDPIQCYQPSIKQLENSYCQAFVKDIDFDKRSVVCSGVDASKGRDIALKTHTTFSIAYDFLVLAHGARATTFNIQGVEQHAFFLRETQDARAIRNTLTRNIMRACLPSTPLHEARRLLSIVIVGGGPTGVELAGELAEFARGDLLRNGSDMTSLFSITIVEAMDVLGTFPPALRKYALSCLEQQGVKFVKAAVSKVTETEVQLKNGMNLPSGLTVWSTGVGPTPLTNAIQCDKIRGGRIAIDSHLRVLRGGTPLPHVYALGDCAGFDPSTRRDPLPTIAAVASRQGVYLSKVFSSQTSQTLQTLIKSNDQSSSTLRADPFQYKSPGMMVSLGKQAAAVALNRRNGQTAIQGFPAFLIWRLAYLSMADTIRSKLYILMNWVGSTIFGRCLSYIPDYSEVVLSRDVMEDIQKQHVEKRTATQKNVEAAPTGTSTTKPKSP